MEQNKLKVIAFVGPNGAGKTTIINELSDPNSNITVKSNYADLNDLDLDNRLVLSKWKYLDSWFSVVLDAQNANVNKLMLTDRCPYDTCANVDLGRNELVNVINISFNELQARGIFVKKILVTANFRVLQKRVEDRLKIEKFRADYHEGDVDYNRRAYEFYLSHSFLWDAILDTSDLTISEMINEAKKILVNS